MLSRWTLLLCLHPSSAVHAHANYILAQVERVSKKKLGSHNACMLQHHAGYIMYYMTAAAEPSQKKATIPHHF